MAQKKIKDLKNATTANDTDLMIIEDAQETQKITFSLLFEKIFSRWIDKAVTFTEASSDTDMASGDSSKTLFGKILKRFNVIKTNIGTLSNLLTTDKGSLVAAINELNGNLAVENVSFVCDTGVVTFTNTTVRRLGKHVTACGNVRTAYISLDSRLITITEYKPAAIVPFIFSSGIYTGTGYVGTDGVIAFNTSGMTGSNDLLFNLSYVSE